MDKYNLETILNKDPLRILDYQKRAKLKSNNQRLIDSFGEINDFYEKEKRKPEKNNDMKERGLKARLNGIRESVNKVSFLKKYDKYGLLKNIDKKNKIKSVDDIFKNDELGILDKDEVDIFNLKNIPKINSERSGPDFVAIRKKCEDFEKYELIFKQCQRDLKKGSRILVNSVESELRAGIFCVLDGVLLYITRVYEGYRGNSKKINRRTRIIFENGTESNMLLRSLGKRLKDSGKMVTILDDDKKIVKDITSEDIANGYIYILRSLSNDDRIVTKKNLYKIGFSKGPIEERVKNAENDPTYLMAPVSITATYKCFNMNPQKLEQLLHGFFGNSCLDIDIVDKNGTKHSPREWFIVPFKVIETVVEMIINRSIINYRYNYDKEEIEIK